ncbi:MAG: adenylate kinase [bacterium]
MTKGNNIKVILLGLPGSGKGTLADFLKKKYDLFHLATGNLLRAAIQNNTPLGKEAEGYMKKGELVPDNLIINLVKEEITKGGKDGGFILDGFPRNIIQAEKLDKMFEEVGQSVDMALEIIVPEEILIQRLTGRRTCAKCGALYNIHFSPPDVENVCNECQGELFVRNDDTVEVVDKRIDVYWKNISPVVEYYRTKNLLKEVNGGSSAGETAADVAKIIEELP